MTAENNLPHQFQIVRIVCVSDKSDLDDPNDKILQNLKSRRVEILHKIKVKEGWVVMGLMNEQDALATLEIEA